ncbi:helix-turn-helix transcriptional regulator [Allobranchiibius sp. GilTou38]|uniref:helix-turn-helix domain-containing protein n=1 Tax=Allobranchiibius sp. GilTou38 TaxID=2815210 RepID=UPI001AA1B2C1|nr:helix-turn-helix transcriptional regulator [Allobranchiibius sp. GilTou38]MBO1766683.1 helix-turn-helix transcriptional regulator [Allobranchiibius sp. GilTou38]
MKWNLRLTAANQGIWTASDLQRMLAQRGMVISAGKMSGLWSGQPASLKLSDLDVLCAVLQCGIDELLIPEPDLVPSAGDKFERTSTTDTGTNGPDVITPQRRHGRTLPPTV